jgi:hypothetical protein
MSPLPSRQATPRQVLTRLLDQPNLVGAVQALPARALGKLIEHIGLEDCGEIVALATTEQLKGIFDDDLWRNERPGKDEQFDANRFALWLEIMLEAGEEFAARKLADLPEDLVTLALHKNVLVINIEALAIAASNCRGEDDGLSEKALESCLCEEIDEYRIISRNHAGWDSILAVLLALDRDHHDFLGRVLAHCCHMASELIDDNGGLYQVLTSDEMLESDVGADRQDRRAEEGFVAPSDAASFLALARTTDVGSMVASKPRDPVTHAYFRSLRGPTRPGTKRGEPKTEATADLASLVEILRDADVLPSSAPKLLPEGTSEAADAQGSGVFTHAMRELRACSASLHDLRMQELAYLANLLAAGCSIEGRAVRPLEAAHAAVAACNLGIEHLLQNQSAPATAVAVLEDAGADKLFRIGWRLLTEDVVLPAARAFEKRLTAEARTANDRARAQRLERANHTLNAAVKAGKPWLAIGKLADLDGDSEMTTLLALIDECPSLRGKLDCGAGAKQTATGPRFIATRQQLRAVQAFLAGL